MNEITQIHTQWRAHLAWHGVRPTFVALLFSGVISHPNVDAASTRQCVVRCATPATSHRWLTRVFRHFAVDYDEIAQAVVN